MTAPLDPTDEPWESWELPDPDPSLSNADALTSVPLTNAAAGSDTDPMIGRILGGRYRVESMLGKGAMGAVYRAKHVKVGRTFAIKVLHERLLQDPKTQKRFEREASLAGKLHHPNVVGVIDVGETDDGIHYMVMEYAEGRTLGSLVIGQMEPRRVITIAQQLLDGLQHAHETGLIHRDFKPENVIVEIDRFNVERPRIVDFGIAILREDASDPTQAERLTTAGLVLGTPHYMAPEHAMGGGIDHRIDLFALGVIIYELMTGSMPYDGDGVDVARANLSAPTPPMGVRVPGIMVDPLLEAFTRLLMQKKPSDRPDTAKDARHLLDTIEKDRPMAARILGVKLPVEEANKPSGQRRLSARAMSQEELSAPNATMHPSGPVPQMPSGRSPHASPPPPIAEAQSSGAPTFLPPGHDSAPMHLYQHAPLAAPIPISGMQPVSTLMTPPPQPRLITMPSMRAETVPEPHVQARLDEMARVAAANASMQMAPAPATTSRWPILAGFIAAIVVVGVIVLATRGSSTKQEAPSEQAAPIAMTTQQPVAPLPPTVQVQPTAPVEQPVTPAAPVNPARPPIAKTTPKPPVAPTQVAVTPVAHAKTIAKQVPKATPTAPIADDANSVAQLYGKVGRELKALDELKGSEVAQPLWMRFRQIRIQDALTAAEKRAATAKILQRLHEEIVASGAG
ncbi:MAG TPA: protein kinase [Kofleriaceae bacterium]